MEIVLTFNLPKDKDIYKAHSNAVHYVSLLETIDKLVSSNMFPDEKLYAIDKAMKGWNA
jgi:hypothetical protein